MNSVHVIARELAHLGLDRLVDLGDDPGEELAVDGLGAAVASGDGLVQLEARSDHLAGVLDHLVLKNAKHALSVLKLQECCRAFCKRPSGLLYVRLIVLIRVHAILDITQIKNRSNDLPNLIDFFLSEAAVAHASQSRLVALLVIYTVNSIGSSRRA